MNKTETLLFKIKSSGERGYKPINGKERSLFWKLKQHNKDVYSVRGKSGVRLYARKVKPAVKITSGTAWGLQPITVKSYQYSGVSWWVKLLIVVNTVILVAVVMALK